jgi:flagellar basal body-associated protein FliL
MLFKIAEKIENHLNQIIMLIVKAIKWFFCLIIPPFVIRFCQKSFAWIKRTTWKIIQVLVIHPLHAAYEWIMKKVLTIKAVFFAPKEKEEKKKNKVQITSFKELILAGLLLFKPIKDYFTVKMAAMTAAQSALFTTLGIAAFFATASIFINGREIVISEKSRAIASIPETQVPQNSLPQYYNIPSKSTPMNNISVPAYIKDIGDYRDIQMDISLTFTDQTTKNYFEKHKYIFIDKLQMEFEPILPEFTLKAEGKKILDEKVKEEVNEILKKHGQSGTVEKVHFDHIMIN